ncbi:MAG: hypothetical protein LUF91_07550 [Oscillospiraceae bacterium]|nr:hypothetical protein [Oscillospiraceae bacterium]
MGRWTKNPLTSGGGATQMCLRRLAVSFAGRMVKSLNFPRDSCAFAPFSAAKFPARYAQGDSIYFTSHASGNTDGFLPAPVNCNVQERAGVAPAGAGRSPPIYATLP